MGRPESYHSASFEEEAEPSINWCLENGYKIPKWLLKCNIKCPYVKGDIFQGKYGPINYSVVGDPSSNLVLTFHGYNATHTTFSIYQSVLSKNGFRVIAFGTPRNIADLYGHGLSGHPKYKVFGNTFSPRYFVDQADEVITHLGYTGRKLSVIGMSMGACLAAAYCEAHPDLVEKMILVSPAGLIPRKPVRVAILRYIQCCIPLMPCCVSRCCFARCADGARRESAGDARAAPYANPDCCDCVSVDDVAQPENINPMVNRMLWTLFVTRRAISSLLGIVNRMPLWTSRELYRRVGSLGKLTLIMFGDADTLTPPECADELSRLFTNSHTIIFSNADHLLSFKNPLQVVSTCLAFLGIPTQEKIAHYTHWLPFDARGRYIPKQERELRHPDSASQEHLDPEAKSDPEDEPVVEDKAKSTARTQFRIFGDDFDVPADRNFSDFGFSGYYSKRRVPLVVVRQFENSDA